MSFTTSSTFNPILTTLMSEWWNLDTGYIGQDLAPVFRTGEQSGQYPIFDKENLLQLPDNIKRAPGTPYTESGLQLSSDSYICEDKGHVVKVDETIARTYRNQFDANMAALKRAFRVVRVNHEKEVKAIVDDGSVSSSSPGTKWDASGSDPIADVKAHREAMRDETGLEPNTVYMTKPVAEALYENAQLVDKFKYSQTAVLDNAHIASVLRVPRVVIAGVYTETAEEGLTSSIANIWGYTVVMAYVSPEQSLEAPNAIRTFVWSEDSGGSEVDILVESDADWSSRSESHRARHNTGVKKVGAPLIRKLTDVLT
jgi:hypothetical protein